MSEEEVTDEEVVDDIPALDDIPDLEIPDIDLEDFDFILLMFSSLAWSHTDEYFDTVDAPHGGQMRMAGPYHMEIIT